jgi:hypothetical protein
MNTVVGIKAQNHILYNAVAETSDFTRHEKRKITNDLSYS